MMWGQYGLSRFQGKDTKLERFLAANMIKGNYCTELSKIGHHFYKGFKNESEKKNILSKKRVPKLLFLNEKKEKTFH